MIIVDTSIWISFFNPLDSNNDKAKKIFLGIKTEDILMFDYIYTESLNVFRFKIAGNYCTDFQQFMNDMEISISFIDPSIIRLATSYFYQFKKLSFTDCLILASAKINDYEIATFDADLQKAAKITL